MEAILLRAARKYLDIFLKGFGRQDLNISLFSGNAVLQNLELNQDLVVLVPPEGVSSARTACVFSPISPEPLHA